MADTMMWPVAHAAHAEQQRLPLGGTLEADFAAWRATPQGREAWEWMRVMAFMLLDRGNTRIGAKHLVEQMRYAKRIKVNNDWTALIGRALEDEHPEFRGRFRHRVRAA